MPPGYIRLGVAKEIASTLRDFSIDPAILIREAGLDPHLFDDGTNVIPHAALDRLLTLCVARSHCTHFGLLVGRRATILSLGLVGRLMQQLETMGDAIRALVSSLRSEFSDDLRLLLRTRLTNTRCSAEDIAELLAMHRRTLSRRLKGSGMGYRAIANEIRCEIARQLLEDTEVPLGQIAAALGCSEASVFPGPSGAGRAGRPLLGEATAILGDRLGDPNCQRIVPTGQARGCGKPTMILRAGDPAGRARVVPLLHSREAWGGSHHEQKDLFASGRHAYNAGLGLLSAMAVTFVSVPAVRAEDGVAQTILKTMTDDVSRQENLSLKYNADVEMVTPTVKKTQFSASGDVTLGRSNKFRISRTGGYADVELISDGSNVTVFDRGGNRFARVPAASTFDEVVDRLRGEAPLELPGADLLLSKPYEELMAGVLEAKHIGRGVVEGVECEHLAFRNLDNDWQIWIEVGDRPVPRKYVITSKAVGAAPQDTLRLREWKSGVSPAPDAFALKPPEGSSGVAIALLKDIDEIRTGVVPGGAK